MKLFNHQLADLYYVERQLVKTLPKMAEKVNSAELSQALMDHAEETEMQVERLEEIFDMLGRTPRGKTCEAMDGILEEAKELMDEFKDDEALDAAVVIAAQKVEHYEITTYGSLCALAEELGMDDVCEIIEETLDEEKMADEKLSELAESRLNREGDRPSSRREEDEEEENEGGSGRSKREHAEV
jgi:ferritin-like metal-binding protein YciE